MVRHNYMKIRLVNSPQAQVIRVQRKGLLAGMRGLQREGDGPWALENQSAQKNRGRVRGQEIVCVSVETICPFLGQILRNNTGEINYNFNAH